MPTVGEQLRAARLERNLSLDEIATRTCIRPVLLEYLEHGEFHNLPGRFFTTSFVRQFADAVGLSGEELTTAVIAEMDDAAAPEAEPTEALDAPEAVSSWTGGGSRIGSSLGRRAAVPVRAIGPVLLIGVGLFFVYESISSSNGSDTVGQARQQAAVALPEVRDALQPTVGTNPGREVESPPASASGADAEEALDPVAAEPGSFLLEVRASETLWFRIVADNENGREATLQPGESVSFRLNSQARASLGNAGGATILIDGQDQGPLGEPGQVRHFRITSEGVTRVSLEQD